MKPILFAVAFAFVSTAGLAQTFSLTLKNQYTDAVSGLSVSGGKVKAFKRIPASSQGTFSVELPDGKCAATVMVNFANGQQHDAGKFDFCKYDILTVWFE